MNTRAAAAIGLVIGIVLTSLYFKLTQSPSPVTTQPATPACPPPVEAKQEECEPAQVKQVLSHDILPPPTWRSNQPDVFTTNREGEAHVMWNQVKGAKGYRVFLEDQHGKVPKTYTTSHTSLYLKDIPAPDNNDEAKLEVRLASANADDKVGEKSNSRVLEIGHQAPVTAPTIKKITVED